MKRVIRATKDTYITNRVINDKFRATDANVGLAGTLDLFKLASESTYSGSAPFVSGTSEPIELSRILIKFDLNPLAALTSSILDITHPSFTCKLKLFDVLGGQTVPSNFSLVLFPLSQSFDEGIGRDINSFEDVDVANFVTASMSTGLATWHVTGADAQGFVGQESIDVMTGSMTLGDLFVVQTFDDGTEDLSMDVTRIVSATLTGQIPDCGFRISFSGTQETDDRTRFVKRFATRHSTNPRLRPQLLASFDDSIQDHHNNFYFDLTGTLFLNNFRFGVPSHIVSGTALTAITGVNSLHLTIVSGNYASGSLFRKVVSASQFYVGDNAIAGVYSASFAISPFESGTILEEVRSAHSATFTEIWGSIDGTVGYYTGSFVVHDFDRSAFSNVPDRLKVTASNIKRVYKTSEKARVRIFVQESGFKLRYTRVPIEPKSLIFNNMHYRIVDATSEEVIFDFDQTTNSTRLSTDNDGMYFDFYMQDLDPGRTYAIDILLDTHGAVQVFKNVGGTFRVDS